MNVLGHEQVTETYRRFPRPAEELLAYVKIIDDQGDAAIAIGRFGEKRLSVYGQQYVKIEDLVERLDTLVQPILNSVALSLPRDPLEIHRSKQSIAINYDTLMDDVKNFEEIINKIASINYRVRNLLASRNLLTKTCARCRPQVEKKLNRLAVAIARVAHRSQRYSKQLALMQPISLD